MSKKKYSPRSKFDYASFEKSGKKRVHAYKAIQRDLAREFGERFEKHVNS